MRAFTFDSSAVLLRGGAADAAAGARSAPARAAATSERFIGSDPFREIDGEAAAGADEAGQDRIAERVLGARGDGGIAMLELLRLEFGDGGAKVRLLAAERAALLAIMAIDLGLDRGGA